MKRILKIIGIIIVACLGLSVVGALINPNRTSTNAPAVSAPASEAITVQMANATEPPPIARATDLPTAVPTLPPAGSDRGNPAPIGSEFAAKEFAIRTNAALRPADDVVKAGNMFNADAETNEEYVSVNVTIACMREAKDKCNVSPFNFKLSGSKGIVYKPEFLLAGVESMLESTEFFGGATIENKDVYFKVDKADANLILEFEAGLILTANAFFAIPEKA